MSDNLEAQEVRRRLMIFFRIPAEVWTDVLKLLPRRTLVQKISPVCYRLKEICNENVKSVHVIRQSDRFTFNISWNGPQVHGQFKQLSGNNCKLANQFRLTNLRICEKNKIILPHCLDLLKGCQISTELNKARSRYTGMTFLDCLTILEPTKPIAIKIHKLVDPINEYWLHPTVLNCNRISLSTPPFEYEDLITLSMDLFDWLHHKPVVVESSDHDGSAVDQVRCLIFSSVLKREDMYLDWLLNGLVQNDFCSICRELLGLFIEPKITFLAAKLADLQLVKNLRDSHGPADRRQFLLILNCDYHMYLGHRPPENVLDLERRLGRVENDETGEVLLFKRVPRVPGDRDRSYRFRRCLIQEEANEEEFYAKVIKRVYGKQQFNIDGEEAKGTEVFVEGTEMFVG